jgi:toxin ParE1/3/4
MASVARTSQAEQDLIEIGVYIAADDPAAADRWIDLIGETCRLLAALPGMGRDRKDLLAKLRSFPVGNYIIFYRPVAGGIIVIRVLHGARDIEALFPRP